MTELLPLLWTPTLQTIEMVAVSAAFSAAGGLLLGILLVTTERGNVLDAPWLHKLLDAVTNVGRSIPFIILMVAIVPFTRWLVGTAIGTTAAIVPLVVGAIPYVGRMVEGALKEVDRGVIEAVLTMGASPFQVIRKAYLPEAVPALIRALTVVTVTLVGYSAMAGTVGGGGLGDLAIRYGYQGFRLDVMVSTVIVLVLLIQAIQHLGDAAARRFEHTARPGRTWNPERVKQLASDLATSPAARWSILGIVLVGGGLFWASTTGKPVGRPLRVGVSPVPHGEILEHAIGQLRGEGVEVQPVYFSDYIQPNLALVAGEIDANYFQHVPFLERFNRDHSAGLVAVGKVHIEPLGLYPGRSKSVAALRDGAVIAIPNDPVNSGRGLLLLQAAGLLKLRTGGNTGATVMDIEANPRHLAIRELEAAQLPRSLEDTDAAVINTNYALAAHLNPLRDAIYLEDSASPYANVVAAAPGRARDPGIAALVEALESESSRRFIREKYKGAVVPAF